LDFTTVVEVPVAVETVWATAFGMVVKTVNDAVSNAADTNMPLSKTFIVLPLSLESEHLRLERKLQQSYR
jgi:hypothetical protein